MGDLLAFRPRAIDAASVRRPLQEPPVIIILPVIRIERFEAPLSPAQRFARFLDRILDGDRPS